MCICKSFSEACFRKCKWNDYNWNLKNSLTKHFELVLDERWEGNCQIETQVLHAQCLFFFNDVADFDTIVTKTTDKLLSREVHLPNDINASDFEIPFSVRINSEALVFLCDNNRHASNCYWVLIGGWNGSKTAIGKSSTERLSNTDYYNFINSFYTPLNETVVSIDLFR